MNGAAVARPVPIIMEVTQAEADLLKRVRSLTAGSHLAILDISRQGLDSITIMGTGKRERLGTPMPPVPALPTLTGA